MEESIADWSQLEIKRGYMLRSPEGPTYQATFAGPGTKPGSAAFFVYAPGYDDPIELEPGDGWGVFRHVPNPTGNAQ